MSDSDSYGGDSTPIRRRRVRPDGTPEPDAPKRVEGSSGEPGSWRSRFGSAALVEWASRKRTY